MSFISPALISRIYQALGRNKGSHAILLLRQHSFERQPAHDGELMAMVTKVADECMVSGDVGRAEDHYRLGLALYEACFCDRTIEALRCASALLSIFQMQQRTSEMNAMLERVGELAVAARNQYLIAKAV